MASEKEYKAVKNFLHNTNQCSREQVKELLREVIHDIAQDEVNRFLETNTFLDIIAQSIQRYGRATMNDVIRSRLDGAIAEYLKKRLDSELKIDFSPKSS